MPQAFLSYAEEDEIFARAMGEWLKNLTWKTFDFKHSMRLSDDWDTQVKRAIRNSDLFIVLHSGRWKDSDYCNKELNFSEALAIPTTAVHLPGSLPSDVADSWLRRKQHVRLLTTDEPESELISIDYKGEAQRFFIDRIGREGFAAFLRGLAPISPYDFDLADSNKGSVLEPYPGPRSLTELEAPIFFGRDEEIGEFLHQLRSLTSSEKSGVLFISGPSGAGKSSFLRAGVLARLFRATSEFYTLPLIMVGEKPISGT